MKMIRVQRFIHSFLFFTAILFASLAQAIPTLHEMQQEVAKILQTPPVAIQAEKNEDEEITQLISARDSAQLPDKAYHLAVAFMQQDRWQEAIWTLKRSGLLSYGIALENSLSSALTSKPVTIGAGIGQGVSGSKWGQLQLSPTRSIKVVVKPPDRGFQNASDGEVWTYDVDDALLLNIVPMAVYRELDGVKYTLHLAVPGAKDSGVQLFNVQNPLYPDIGLLDFIIGHLDRHGANSMFSASGRLFAIDHGRVSFSAANYAKGNPKNYNAAIVPSAMTLQRIQTLTTDQFVSLLPKSFPEYSISYLRRNFEAAKKALDAAVAQPLPMYLNKNDEKPVATVLDLAKEQQEALAQKKALEEAQLKLEQERLQQAQLQAAQQAEEQRRLHAEQLKQKQQNYDNEVIALNHGLPVLNAQNKEYVKRDGFNLTENGHRFLQLIQLGDEVQAARRDVTLLQLLVSNYWGSKLGYRDFRRLYVELLNREITPEFIAETQRFFPVVAPLHVFFTDEDFKQKYQDPKEVTPVLLEHYKQIASKLPAVMSCRYVYW